MRVLGLLGALDPHKHKQSQNMDQKSTVKDFHSSDVKHAGKEESNDALIALAGGNPEELYPTVAIAALMHILKDQSLVQHHHLVIQSLAYIFKSLGIKSVPYLSQIMPSFINAIRTCDPTFREVSVHDTLVLVMCLSCDVFPCLVQYLFQQLGSIISIIKQHARNYMNDIFVVISVSYIVGM